MPAASSGSPFLFFPVFRPGLPVFSCFRFQRFNRSFNARPCIFLYLPGLRKFFAALGCARRKAHFGETKPTEENAVISKRAVDIVERPHEAIWGKCGGVRRIRIGFVLRESENG